MKGSSCLVAVLLGLALVLTAAGPARAPSDVGLWYGGVDCRFAMEESQTSFTAFFLGGYTKAYIEGEQYIGEYRFTYGMSDNLNHALNYDSRAYYLDAGGTLRLPSAQGLHLRLGAGATLWWGAEEIGSGTYVSTFFQARGGTGIGTAYQMGSLRIDAGMDLYLTFDFIGRNDYDFTSPHLLEGLRADLNASCAWDLGPNATLRLGLRYYIGGSESLFNLTHDTGLVKGFEGTLGVAWRS
ncbi:MAG: hypothetical protein ACM3XS_09935 [Bacteroidota bacterium]